MACFDDECEYWGQETPEPNLIIPLQPEDQESVRQALAVLADADAGARTHGADQGTD